MDTRNLRVGDELILERMTSAEQLLLTQADALDMKASYLLVVLVFLAQLSTTFLSRDHLSRLQQCSQWAVCLLLVGSGIFLLIDLGIKKFQSEDASKLEVHRDQVIKKSLDLAGYKEAKNPEQYLQERLTWSLIESSKARLPLSEEINRRKVVSVERAYWLAAIAFLLDVLFMVSLVC